MESGILAWSPEGVVCLHMLPAVADMESEHDYLLKVLLIGDTCVGKSTLLLRYADHEWRDGLDATIGVDFKICTHKIQDKIVKMQIWDTAGQERFRTIVSSYFRGAHGVIVCYDITDRQSFVNVGMWVAESKRYTDACLLLVATKADLEAERKVSLEEGQQLAEGLQVGFVETSSKKDINVQDAFQTLCCKALDHACKAKPSKPATGVVLDHRLPSSGAGDGSPPAGHAGIGCCGP
mmetsp:Transcript_16751/g.52519  ORF Transcript_16751/g.52519 Transcript_16751/m.52519 type:complete len:236 (-) Transcript_16751:387-1094(-)